MPDELDNFMPTRKLPSSESFLCEAISAPLTMPLEWSPRTHNSNPASPPCAASPDHAPESLKGFATMLESSMSLP